MKLAAAKASQADEEAQAVRCALFPRKNDDVFGKRSAEEGQKHCFACVLVSSADADELLAEGRGHTDTADLFFAVANGSVVVESDGPSERQFDQLSNLVRHGGRQQQRLAGNGARGDDLSELSLETHLEQAIGLV
jgi:hypothetical protein